MQKLLILESVRFGWDTHTDVLDIESFSLEQGQHHFLMGPSGCGKSTLLSLIGGVVTPRQGKVILDGKDLTQKSASARDKIRADSIGFIFQQFNLVPYLSTYDNVLLPCQFSKTRAENARMNAGDPKAAATKLLNGFFTDNAPDFHRPVAQLSVGQQQRVAAARALIGSPTLIIADEPTSALDHNNRHLFMSLLLAEADRQNTTLLFVSHDPTLADPFHKVYDMAEINNPSIK